jgi:hypothetical protein
MTMRLPGFRAALLVWLVAAPSVLGALSICALEAYRWLRPESALFVAPHPDTLTQAIVDDDYEGAYAFIRGGQDPNRPIEFRDDRLTGGRAVRVSPLLLAVATGSENSLRMLLGFGARMVVPPDSLAGCLADALDDSRLASLVRALGAAPASACPATEGATAYPLLGYIVPEPGVRAGSSPPSR